MIFWIISAFFIVSLPACKKSEAIIPLSSLEVKGKNIFIENCLNCHNPNIARPETIGPNIAGSSIEVVTARVLRAQYPEHYLFKRKSHLMPAFPQLEKDIPAIHAYVNSSEFKIQYTRE